MGSGDLLGLRPAGQIKRDGLLLLPFCIQMKSRRRVQLVALSDIERLGKGQNIPDDINKIDLCMLVDSGYTIEDEYAQWQYKEGQIILNLNQPDSAPQITPPSAHQELGWRCAIERGSDGSPL